MTLISAQFSLYKSDLFAFLQSGAAFFVNYRESCDVLPSYISKRQLLLKAAAQSPQTIVLNLSRSASCLISLLSSEVMDRSYFPWRNSAYDRVGWALDGVLTSALRHLRGEQRCLTECQMEGITEGLNKMIAGSSTFFLMAFFDLYNHLWEKQTGRRGHVNVSGRHPRALRKKIHQSLRFFIPFIYIYPANSQWFPLAVKCSTISYCKVMHPQIFASFLNAMILFVSLRSAYAAAALCLYHYKGCMKIDRWGSNCEDRTTRCHK